MNQASTESTQQAIEYEAESAGQEGENLKAKAIDILMKNLTTIEDVESFKAAAFSNLKVWQKVEQWVREVLKDSDPDYDQKYAIGLAALGLYDLAESKLVKLKNLPVAACLLGRIYMETGREREAIVTFSKIHKRVPEVKSYHIYLAEAYEAAGDLDGFRRELELIESEYPDDVDTLSLKGVSAERAGDYDQAKELYRKALDKKTDHTQSLFRLAYRLDLEGHDDEAIDLYQQCVMNGVSNVAALVNLGLLYDDAERFDDALRCFELVDKICPNNRRAQIYLRDVRASTTMYYDEEKERKEDKHAQILRIPVTDFELSVRSRNCLSKMNIRTLGDLIKKSEAELLAFKNFGETSLQEIKGILYSKGLRLGMILTDSKDITNILEPAVLEPIKEPEANDNKSLDELDLSVRSRNCLTFLQITTLGQLLETTEHQLVACKNFGQTSLNEIRKKLADQGLSLKV